MEHNQSRVLCVTPPVTHHHTTTFRYLQSAAKMSLSLSPYDETNDPRRKALIQKMVECNHGREPVNPGFWAMVWLGDVDQLEVYVNDWVQTLDIRREREPKYPFWTSVLGACEWTLHFPGLIILTARFPGTPRGRQTVNRSTVEQESLQTSPTEIVSGSRTSSRSPTKIPRPSGSLGEPGSSSASPRFESEKPRKYARSARQTDRVSPDLS